MNTDFPRILTLLRKERGISQKQAAAELGISQALLSHYEKGIRECGLDFVVRTADFYGVSCDYLLGRSPERTGRADHSRGHSGARRFGQGKRYARQWEHSADTQQKADCKCAEHYL